MISVKLYTYFALAVLCSAWWMDFTTKSAKNASELVMVVRALSLVCSYGFGIAFAIALCNLYGEKPVIYGVIFCAVGPVGIGMSLGLIIGGLSRLRRNPEQMHGLVMAEPQ